MKDFSAAVEMTCIQPYTANILKSDAVGHYLLSPWRKVAQPWADFSMLYYSIMLIHAERGFIRNMALRLSPFCPQADIFPQGDNECGVYGFIAM